MSGMHTRHLEIRAGDFQVGPVDLCVPSGGYTVVLGPSGSGKSLLLETLAGHHVPTGGRIRVNDTDVTLLPPHKRPVCLMHQGLNLFPHLTGYQNIAYGWRPDPGRKSGDMRADIESLCHRMGIEHLLHQFPGSYSGGEAQRVALARAIVTRPAVLLLDEPLASLDDGSAREMIGILKRIHESGQTILHVTHDYRECLALADRVVVLHGGKMVQEGELEAVFLNPSHPFIAGLCGRTNAYFGQLEAAAGPVNGTFRVRCGEVLLLVSGKAPECRRGLVSFRPEDVVLSRSPIHTSALNVMEGRVKDMVKNERGMAVRVLAGLEMTAQLSERSVNRLELSPGTPVQVAIKANAIQFTGGPS